MNNNQARRAKASKCSGSCIQARSAKICAFYSTISKHEPARTAFGLLAGLRAARSGRFANLGRDEMNGATFHLCTPLTIICWALMAGSLDRCRRRNLSHLFSRRLYVNARRLCICPFVARTTVLYLSLPLSQQYMHWHSCRRTLRYRLTYCGHDSIIVV